MQNPAENGTKDAASQQERLLHAVNSTAAALLAPLGEADFGASLLAGMEIMGHCVDADRVHIWRNETIDGVFCYVNQFRWLNDPNKKINQAVLKRPYSDNPEWERKFLNNEYINGPISALTPSEQAIFGPQGIKSILAIPLYLQGKLYGFFSFDDCSLERTFPDEEVKILRSAGLMLASAINNHEQAARLKEAQDHNRVMVNAIPVVCTLWDKDCNVFDCNEAAIKLFKAKDKQEYLSRFAEFFPKDQPDGTLSYEILAPSILKAFAEGKNVMECTHRTLDGVLIPAEVTLVRVPYGDNFVVAGYTRDLREHKQMMENIERRDHLLATVNNAATVLLRSETGEFERDIHKCMRMIGEAVDVNRVCIWKNHTKDGRLYCTQIYEWLDNAEPQLHNEITIDVLYDTKIPGWEETLSQGKCINNLVRNLSPEEQAQLSPQGVLSIFVAPLFIHDQFWGFIGFDDCLRERIFSDSELSILRSGGLLLANAFLHNENTSEMIRLQADLKNALKDAQKANNAKSNFLARMSHEMRTPLNAIIGLSELALGSEEPEQENYQNLVKISNAGITLLNTVNDILDISKIEAGKLELKPVEYDIPSLINDAITQSIMRKGEKPISFIANIDENLPARLYGDDLRIKQLLNNLLSNAFKYTNEGTVELAMSSIIEGNSVRITVKVSDTGKGIKTKDIGNLFNDYSQADMESNRGIEGTGLGLSITKKIVEMMGGSISVQSEYGKGSVFTAEFIQGFVSADVIGRETAAGLKNFNYSDQKRHKNFRMVRLDLSYARVLVVDDVETNLDVAKGMMKPYGLHVDCASSGQEAVSIIRAGKVRYNAIFMDHMMPDMDGIEATRIIREEIGTEYAKTIPIIALTANAIIGNEEMFLNKGFQAFISKPIELERLDAVIREWVRDKELEKTLNDGHVYAEGCKYPELQSEEEQQLSMAKLIGLDIEKGLKRFGGDAESYMQVLHSYVDNTPPLLETARNVNRGNLPDYTIIVHGIKGASRGICAEQAGNLAEALEKASRAGDFAYVSAKNQAFIETVSKLITDLKDLLAKLSALNLKPQKDKPEKETLVKLSDACIAYNMDKVDEAIAELDAYDYEADDGLATWLKENVDAMNFAQITERLSNLVK